MPPLVRISVICLCSLTALSQTACNTVPPQMLQQSQLRARQLYDQNNALATERDQASQSAQSLAQKNAALQSELEIANQRVDNLHSDRSQLQQRYVSLLQRSRDQESPLSQDATRRFQELDRKFPGFEFDPQTGVSKFHSDILYSSGSAQIKSSAKELLKEFASIMNDGTARELNILVVGHTDDKRIVKQRTRTQHPTNWHLSTNRAKSVVLALKSYKIAENRMGAAGYSMFQPVVPNADEKTRQQNRRVEIFVLAPDAVVAGWDPADTSTN